MDSGSFFIRKNYEPDANTWTTTGIYTINDTATANAPETYGICFVYSTGGYFAQIAISVYEKYIAVRGGEIKNGAPRWMPWIILASG